MQVVKQGDTVPLYWRIVDERTREPVDLTAATVAVHVSLSGTGAPIILPAVIDDPPTAGRVKHGYSTLAAGTYALEIEVTGTPGIQTAPSSTNATLRVVPDIA